MTVGRQSIGWSALRRRIGDRLMAMTALVPLLGFRSAPPALPEDIDRAADVAVGTPPPTMEDDQQRPPAAFAQERGHPKR